MSQQNSLTLAANGAPQKLALGQYVYALIRTASAAAEVSFDGQNWQAANLNDMAGPFNPPHHNIYFRASGGVAAVVTFSTSLVPFAAQSTSQRVASTYCVATTYVSDAVGVIPSGNLGHQRKLVIFSVLGAGTVYIKSLAGVTFLYVTAGSPVAIESDAVFNFTFNGVVTSLAVGEIYYSAS